MAFLKYEGPLDRIEVSGYGHFGYGDEKQVDEVTAGAFKNARCAEEGWQVRDDNVAQPAGTPAPEQTGTSTAGTPAPQTQPATPKTSGTADNSLSASANVNAQ